MNSLNVRCFGYPMCFFPTYIEQNRIEKFEKFLKNYMTYLNLNNCSINFVVRQPSVQLQPSWAPTIIPLI